MARKTKVWIVVENYIEDVSVNVFKTLSRAMEVFEDCVRDNLETSLTTEQQQAIVDEALDLLVFEYPSGGFRPCTIVLEQKEVWE